MKQEVYFLREISKDGLPKEDGLYRCDIERKIDGTRAIRTTLVEFKFGKFRPMEEDWDVTHWLEEVSVPSVNHMGAEEILLKYFPELNDDFDVDDDESKQVHPLHKEGLMLTLSAKEFISALNYATQSSALPEIEFPSKEEYSKWFFSFATFPIPDQQLEYFKSRVKHSAKEETK